MIRDIGQIDLWHVCRTLYFPARFRIRSDLTRRQYLFAVRELEALLDRPAVVDDLSDETFVELVRFMEAQKLAPRTINERIGRLKTLMNWLWRKGYIRCGPTVEKIPEPVRTPRAWNRQELIALFHSARNMPGRVGPFLASAWWTAFLGTAWWTGERTNALLQVRWEWLQGAVLYVPAEVRKGGRKDAVYRLPVECMGLLAGLSSDSLLIFPWPARQGQGRRKADGDACRQTFYKHYDRLLVAANLPTGRYNKLQKVRKSHATWKEIMGSNPTRSLMHDDPATTWRYYLDAGLIDSEIGDDQPLFRPWGDSPLPRERPPGG